MGFPFILFFRSGTTEASRRVVHVFKIRGLSHRLGRRRVGDVRSREATPEGFEDGRILSPVLLGELDRELDVHVAEVVVTVRRHTLAADHLDGAY